MSDTVWDESEDYGTKAKLCSSDYAALYGRQYYVGQTWQVHTFSTSLPVSNLLPNNDIKLVEDVTGYAQWALNRMIQRHISRERVRSIVDAYLLDTNRVTKFFPAITVVLLPVEKELPVKSFTRARGDANENPLKMIDGLTVNPKNSNKTIVDFGPVVLNWHKRKIGAFVVDGQHRVAALRELVTEHVGLDGSSDWSIPACFVVFDNTDDIDMVRATRRMFIDVNNTPRLVAEQRLIFIDDSNIYRRFTAGLLGIHGNADDPYVELDESNDIDDPNNVFLSRYLIREDRSDDEERSIGSRTNHAHLLPWEVSHIRTVHETLHGELLFSNEIGGTRDIRAICRLLNPDVMSNIEEVLKEHHSDELNRLQRLRKWKDVKTGLTQASANDAEIAVFSRYYGILKEYLEYLAGLDNESDEENQDPSSENVESDSNHEEKRALERQYASRCSDAAALSFQPREVDRLFQTSLNTLLENSVNFWRSLWFVAGVYESFENVANQSSRHREALWYLLSTFKDEPIKESERSKDIRLQTVMSLYKQRNNRLSDEDEEYVEQFLESLETLNPESNLCRTVVGQQMLFILARPHLTDNIDGLINQVNKIGKNGIFNRDYAVSVDLQLFQLNGYYVWSEILVRQNNSDTRMFPGLPNARKAKLFIDFVLKDISSRNEADSTAGIALSDYNRLSKAVGSGVYRHLVNKLRKTDAEIATAILEASNQGTVIIGNHVSHGESTKLTSSRMAEVKRAAATFQQVTLQNPLCKLLGSMMLKEMVPCIRQQAKL